MLKDFIFALDNSREIDFFYVPQHEETIRKILKIKHHFPINTPENSMPVKMLPLFFAFAPGKVLICGESYFSGSGLPVFRQYEIKGIQNIKINSLKERKIKEDLKQKYESSMHIWQGGQIYNLKLEEKNISDPAKSKILSLTVNGEEEILSYVAASLGRLKIMNPPEAIIDKAKQFGLSEDMVFKFEKNDI